MLLPDAYRCYAEKEAEYAILPFISVAARYTLSASPRNAAAPRCLLLLLIFARHYYMVFYTSFLRCFRRGARDAKARQSARAKDAAPPRLRYSVALLLI